MWSYPIKLHKDTNGTFLVTCPDLPEVTTFGEDRADARQHALDAIEEAIAARMAHREPVPRPSQGKIVVALPSQAVAKILLYRTMRRRGVSKAGLARSLGWHRPQVDRLLNLGHGSRLDVLEAAFGALGARMVVAIDEAGAGRRGKTGD